MKEDVGLLAVNRNIGRGTLGDGIGWGGDILIVLVVCLRLRRVGLDGLWNVSVGHWDTTKCKLTVSLFKFALGTESFYC